MVYDDRPGYPLSFLIRCDFLGTPDQAAIRDALETIAPRHPLLRARVEERDKNLYWVWDRPEPIPIHWGPWAWSRAISPFQECGLRVTVELAERSSMYFEFHHSSCDGDGAGLFILDFLKAYHESKGGEKRPWSKVDSALLLSRGEVPWPKKTRDFQDHEPLSWWKRLKFAFDFLTCVPEQITGDRQMTPTPRMFTSHIFDRDQTSLLLEALASRESNLNDVGFALLFRTLARWQQEKTPSPSFRKLRLLMPTSIRRLSDRRMGAANRTTFAFLTRCRSECLGNLSDLHVGIRQENEFIKQTRPDLTTLGGIELAAKFGLLKLVRLLPTAQSSAILTNMGDRSPLGRGFPRDSEGFRVGDVVLESISGTSPISARARIALASGRVADRMSVSLRCDPATFSLEAEQELLHRYVEAWQDWAKD
jgi:hypothetical protein